MSKPNCQTCQNLNKVIDATFDFLIANKCEEVLIGGTFKHEGCTANSMFFCETGLGKIQGIGVLEQIKFRLLTSVPEND